LKFIFEERGMGLFGHQGCPQENEYLKIYGIPAPEKWNPARCQDCQYQENQKCQYKKAMAQQAANLQRGQPVLIKRVNLASPAEQRKKAESEALKKAGLTAQEQKEYWVISTQIDITWEASGPESRRELLEHLDQWKMQLERGLGPQAAYQAVLEWLRQREEFRKS
jgi:hypothetical protein